MKYCPVCGKELIHKIITKPKNFTYRRKLKSWICEDCDYAEYDSNPREQSILDGEL